ncbi:hypothetical protein V2O64_15520 [Verrucomicrobiaceae bacterium 227]
MLKSLLSLALLASLSPAAEIEAGKAIDYSKLAFYPDRWEKQGFEMQLHPWVGEHIAFLTVTDDFDPKAMTGFIGKLDGGWKTYLDFTGKSPRPTRQVDGKTPIAAIPGSGLTCGFGCGYVGHTGIEANGFYTNTYKSIQKDPRNTPHIYFYEMGRNFFTFGERHNAFTTGFAVFMRYVCIDTLELVDGDKRTREVINNAVDGYAKTDLPFLKAFTNAYGLTEKDNRLKHSPTDQPVLYASAMLKLWKAHGNDWAKAFFRQIHTAPKASQNSKEGARTQAISWYLAASLAAKKDLAPVFVEQWRLPLTDLEKKALKDVKWDDESLTVASLHTVLGAK